MDRARRTKTWGIPGPSIDEKIEETAQANLMIFRFIRHSVRIVATAASNMHIKIDTDGSILIASTGSVTANVRRCFGELIYY